MYQIKKEFQNIGAEVIINKPELIRQGLSNKIPLDLASQKELKLLFEMNHPYVEKIEKKSKEQA